MSMSGGGKGDDDAEERCIRSLETLFEWMSARTVSSASQSEAAGVQEEERELRTRLRRRRAKAEARAKREAAAAFGFGSSRQKASLTKFDFAQTFIERVRLGVDGALQELKCRASTFATIAPPIMTTKKRIQPTTVKMTTPASSMGNIVFRGRSPSFEVAEAFSNAKGKRSAGTSSTSKFGSRNLTSPVHDDASSRFKNISPKTPPLLSTPSSTSSASTMNSSPPLSFRSFRSIGSTAITPVRFQVPDPSAGGALSPTLTAPLTPETKSECNVRTAIGALGKLFAACALGRYAEMGLASQVAFLLCVLGDASKLRHQLGNNASSEIAPFSFDFSSVLSKSGMSFLKYPDHFAHFALCALEEALPAIAALGAASCNAFAKSIISASVATQEEGEEAYPQLTKALRSVSIRQNRGDPIQAAREGQEAVVDGPLQNVFCSSIKRRHGFTLPFCDSVDSRSRCSTREQMDLYQNRENCKDSFLNLVRNFRSIVASNRPGFQGGADANVVDLKASCEEAGALVDSVLAQNLPWFSQFFVTEMVQVCLERSSPSSGDDEDAALHAFKTSAKVSSAPADETQRRKMSRLHRRLSQPDNSAAFFSSGSSAAHQGVESRRRGGSAGGGSRGGKGQQRSRRRSGGRSSTPFSRDNRKRSGPPMAAKANRFAFEAKTLAYFENDEIFFYAFLVGNSSPALRTHLRRVLVCCIERLCRDSSANETSKSFAEKVLKLKLLGKFYGYIEFSANWGMKDASIIAPEDVANGPTIVASACYPGLFHCLDCIVNSVTEGYLCYAISWACSFLRMMFLDGVAMESKYHFHTAATVLRSLYSSPLLDLAAAPGFANSTKFFLLAEIESLFLYHWGKRLHAPDDEVEAARAAVRARWPAFHDALKSTKNRAACVQAVISDDGTNLRSHYDLAFRKSLVVELKDALEYAVSGGSASHFLCGNTLVGARFAAKMRSDSSSSASGRRIKPTLVAVGNDDMFGSASNHGRRIKPTLLAADKKKSMRENDIWAMVDGIADHFFRRHPDMQGVVDAVANLMLPCTVDACLEESAGRAIMDAWSHRPDDQQPGDQGSLVYRAAYKAKASARKRTMLISQKKCVEAIKILCPPSTCSSVISAARNICMSMINARVDAMIEARVDAKVREKMRAIIRRDRLKS